MMRRWERRWRRRWVYPAAFDVSGSFWLLKLGSDPVGPSGCSEDSPVSCDVDEAWLRVTDMSVSSPDGVPAPLPPTGAAGFWWTS